ncbi:MarR family winged helix-turn-helix transcriptional regulator [Streptomyces sp. NBC_01387]|nr:MULTISPECIES: MarR family winged helix-turn-helix transcriptional regulator [unclassified Streptomyces]WSC18828.1 MarR family winged helix-turn-helix transcriptional regulator [Streptomyces sp. NBC_01766]WSV52864.1 MarR family winged helix-turn-helix transcriptional regulator [Streptomyces sp. NBC_01014]
MDMAKGEQPAGFAAALVRTAFLVQAVYTEASREYGLPVQQAQLVCVLMAQPRGMSELSAMLGLEKSSLTGLVDRAERRGLVRREPDPQDRRAVRVALTVDGSTVAGDFYADTTARMEALADGIGPAERDRLAAVLGRVVRANEVPVVFMEPKSA